MPNPRGELPLEECNSREKIDWANLTPGEIEVIVDKGLRHKPGKTPKDYLKHWLWVARQFGFATHDDSFGEFEKEFAIIIKRLVVAERARADAPLRRALAEQAKILLSALYPAMLLTKLDMEAKQTVLDNDNKVLGVVHVLQEIANGEALATAPEATGVREALGAHIQADAYRETFPDNDEDAAYLRKSETWWRLTARSWMSESEQAVCAEMAMKRVSNSPEVKAALDKMAKTLASSSTATEAGQ